MRVLFWNVKGSASTAELALSNLDQLNIDLLMMAECPRIEPKNFADSITTPGGDTYVEVLRRKGSRLAVTEVAKNGDARIRALRVTHTDGADPLLLFGAHLPSRNNHIDPRDQDHDIEGYAEWILKTEKKYGKASLLVGDLNLDPYTPAMVGIRGFNALMTPRQRSRAVKKYRRRTFFNPTWRLFGREPYGTYHLKSPGSLGYYWHLLDQALIRPELASHFVTLDVECKLGDTDLFTPRARTPSRRFSDHFPLLLEMNDSLFRIKV